MDPKIASALIAGGVSLIASLITFYLTSIKIKQENKALTTKLNRELTNRLYDKRLPSYQEASSLISKLSKRQAPTFPYSQNHTASVLNSLTEWKSSDGSLILSDTTNRLFHQLLDLLSEHAFSEDPPERLSDNIWEVKNKLVSSFRSDISLIFSEES